MRRRSVVFGLLAALVAATGCTEGGVRERTVPKPTSRAVRLLAVIVPRGEATWFLKLSGPADAVRDAEPAFRAFAESMRFDDKGEPAWTDPAGWQSVESSKERHATFRTPGGLEAQVNTFPGKVGTVLSNVNRWRGQIGLSPIGEKELPAFVSEVTAAGAKATWVDLLNPGLTPVPLALAKPAPAAGTSPRVKFQTPSGWTPLPATGFRAAAFRVADGEANADVTVIVLNGEAGGLRANVNRWRGEIGLGEQDEATVRAEAKELPVEGQPATYVDLLGEPGPNRQRTLGVIVSRPGVTWFVKLKGPADLVAREQARFESFARSLQLTAGSTDG